MKTLAEREAWAQLRQMPALERPEDVKNLDDINRLEIIHARPALERQIQQACPVEWAIQERSSIAFREAWDDLGWAFRAGAHDLLPDLLVRAAVYEAGQGSLATAVELLGWAAIYRLVFFRPPDQSSDRPP